MNFGVGRSCRVDACQSEMRGLATAGRTFESELASGSRVERNQLCPSLIAHSSVADHPRTLADPALFIWTIRGVSQA